MSKTRPIFCGNFDYEARQSEIQRLFNKYGHVARVDMKSGFAFVYMEDDHDAADAIRNLDNYDFGRQRRRLRVEWAKHADGPRRPIDETQKRSTEGLKPAKTLFVINFDPIRTRVRDLERHFEAYGKLVRVHIRKNFAFVQYENQDEATKALECTNMSKVLDRVITVEYAIRDDGEPPVRQSGGRRSSPEPRGGRGGRDYNDRSPIHDRRGSPVYDRYRSPIRRRSRSPDYRPYNAPR